VKLVGFQEIRGMGHPSFVTDQAVRN